MSTKKITKIPKNRKVNFKPFQSRQGEGQGQSQDVQSSEDDVLTDSEGSVWSTEKEDSIYDSETDIEMSSGKSDEDGPEAASTADKLPKFPPTHLVLTLNPNISPAALSWLVKKITGKRSEGGAELLLRCEPFDIKNRERLVLHVSASKLKFLEMAEQMDLKKEDSTGVLREFTVRDLDSFLYDDIHLGNLLTPSEKQIIVLHELENIRTVAGEQTLPGYPNISLYFGQSILQVYLQEGLISNYYPLHEKAALENLRDKWLWAFFQIQPLEEIRNYFGDGISLYFSFLGAYTTSLFAPAIFSIFHLILPESEALRIFFCVFNVVFVTVFLEVWKRKCNELAYIWGTLRMTKWEEPRPNYRGIMALDPVTERYQPKYPWWKTSAKAYCISLPIVLICMLGAFWIMLYSFWAEEMLLESKFKGSKMAGMLILLPSVIYSVAVWFMNYYYRILATHLTEWENHRTQSQFERHRVTKLVVFEFVNNFMSMFYIAFYLQDFAMLRSQVTVMLIIQQAINHFQEALLPLVIKKGFASLKYHLSEKWPNQFGNLSPLHHRKNNNKSNGSLDRDGPSKEEEAAEWMPKKLGLKFLEDSDPRIQSSKEDAELEYYEDSYDDYLELFIQFGYVYLFSSVYPLAAGLGILNNVLEIRADAWKLCKIYQRPLSRRVKDIGAWQIAFEVMGGIAVMTNCALLCLCPSLRSLAPLLSSAEWLLLFVIIEHMLLALIMALRQLIPDVPSSVKQALARLEYQSRQALKNERAFKAKRQLTRRFKTIHIGRKKTTVGNSMRKGSVPVVSEKTHLLRRIKAGAKQNTLDEINKE